MTHHLPLLIEPGATFTLRVDIEIGDQPITADSGYVASLRVFRPRRPLTAPALHLVSGSGNEVVFEPEGVVVFTASPQKTETIPGVLGRKYYYVVELTAPDGHKHRLLEGRVKIASA